MPDLTDRFVKALAFATERHGEQRRKGTEVPYVSHLLGTCALVLEAGGDEDEAIAALLHDTLEDQVATFDEVADVFGERVAGIVRECSDSEEDPKPSWKERKAAYLEALPHHSRSAILVSNADKLHNLRTIVADYRQIGSDSGNVSTPRATRSATTQLLPECSATWIHPLPMSWSPLLRS